MQIKIFKDYNKLSFATAEIIINQVKEKPDSVICFASGDTPKLTCHYIVEKATKHRVDFSKVTFVGLDEWVGIPPSDSGSCHFFFRKNLIEPLHLTEAQVHLFKALSNDLKVECIKMDESILSCGGIDIILVGIGLNGHIGFNEPGTSPELYSHVKDLDALTIQTGQKYFNHTMPLQKGITLGFKHFNEAKKAIIIANGLKKAEIIKKTVEEGISIEIPASIINQHRNGYILLDEEAASLISPDFKHKL
ncbi:MAG: glucosamine-6-phosphate deaminase [Bacteroidota bacterium]|nr:glucosamine-6-phosphate deaminase [Bacteroidota bacterium]